MSSAALQERLVVPARMRAVINEQSMADHQRWAPQHGHHAGDGYRK